MEKRMNEDILNLLAQLEAPDTKEAHHDYDKDGYIECKGGRIVVTDPEPGGRKPSLVSALPVEIRVNDTVATKPMEVSAADRIEVQMVRDKPYQLSVSSDSMKVRLHLFRERMTEIVLKESPPAFFYVPLVEHIPLTRTEPIKAQVLQEARQLGIQVPIDEAAITRALDQQDGSPTVIAEGTPVERGRDGFIEMMFENPTERMIDDWKKNVDYRNHRFIPSVAADETIGMIHKAVEGKPGVNVFGNEVHPPDVSEVKAEARRNVRITDDGRIKALKAGRPSLTGEAIKYFDIQTVHVVEGDVDLSVGNVLFHGDVLVQGDVKEGMRVEATGNITVMGSAYHAVLVSSQHVYIKGHAATSQVYGGKIGLLYSKVYDLIKQIIKLYAKLEQDVKAAEELSRRKQMDVTIGQIFWLLIERQYPALQVLVQEFSELLQHAGRMIPVEFRLLARLLQLFRNKELLQRINRWPDIQKIYDYLGQIKVQIENSVCDESDIVVSFANLSQLETNGSLVVTGQGLMNCQVKTGKNCLFKDAESSIKGGRIIANGRIHAFEVGTPYGRHTYLESGESVKVKKAEGTIIKVGDKVVEILDEQHDLFFSLDKQGNLHQEKNRHRDRKI